MNPFLYYYLIGCVVSLVIQIIILLSSHVVKVSNILGYILNTALSWGCIATFAASSIVNLLNKKHWNPVLWTSREYKEMEAKAKRFQPKKK